MGQITLLSPKQQYQSTEGNKPAANQWSGITLSSSITRLLMEGHCYYYAGSFNTSTTSFICIYVNKIKRYSTSCNTYQNHKVLKIDDCHIIHAQNEQINLQNHRVMSRVYQISIIPCTASGTKAQATSVRLSSTTPAFVSIEFRDDIPAGL